MPESHDIAVLRRLQIVRLALLLLIEIFFLLVLYIGGRVYGSYLADNLRRHMTDIGRITALRVAESSPGQDLHPFLSAVAHQAGLESLFVVGSMGRSLGDSRPDVRPGSRYSPILLDHQAFADALSGRPASGPPYSLAGFSFRSAYVPVHGGGGRVDAVVVVAAGEGFAAVLYRLQRTVRWVMIIAGLGLMLYIGLFILSDIHAARVERYERRSRGLALLGFMAAEIAHRVRNPLAIIMSTAEALRRKYKSRSDDDQLYDYIPEEVSRVNTAVEDLLSLGHPTPRQVQDLSLEEIVSGAVAQAALGKRFPTIKVAIDVESDPSGRGHRIFGDRRALTEAVRNLLVNAAEASGGDGTISVLVMREPSGRSVLAVADSGPGIPAATLRHMFDPFYTTRSDGTGLGLAIVGRIVDQHGAEISVSSNEQGASFRIVFPRDEVEYGKKMNLEDLADDETADS
ncbi:MAG: hypothetical protein JW909_03450 [Planctomycetes bacterium]|nr:hypothetical protein [Planctomycetota bacterium]